MKTLVIAEKPSVAKDIAQVLGANRKVDDHFENDEYIVTSAVGHLVELAMPEDINIGLKRWSLKDLPIIPEKFLLKPSEKTKDRLKSLTKLLNSKEIDLVINACDSGREGELIFTYIYDVAKSKKPFQRLWMVSMTPEGIRDAFDHLRSAEEMFPLQEAARCRSEADWLVGINGTRAITLRMSGAGSVSSVGRVQTPTLAMIVERDRAIRNFTPVPYWRITGEFSVADGKYSGVYFANRKLSGKNEEDRLDRFWNEAEAREVLSLLEGEKHGIITEKKKRTKQSPARLYDLTTLQREANTRLHFSAATTLQIAQALYEKHKLITYPRTDSKALPNDYPAVCEKTLKALHADYQPLARKIFSDYPINPNDKKIFNNKEVSDHFAIIPTPQGNIKNLTEAEAKIYDMIVRRFIAVFYPAAEYDVTTRTTTLKETYSFISEGRVLAKMGWLEVYNRGNSEEKGTLPKISAEDGEPAKAAVEALTLIQEQTRPQPHFTEATLLSAMETAGKLVDDEDLSNAMKDKGLGTPATRAQIIDNLINTGYVNREDRALLCTQKAEYLMDFLSTLKISTLMDPAMTGEWEFKLHEMERREFPREKFMKEIVELTRKMTENVKNFDETSEDTAKPSSLIHPKTDEALMESFRNYFTKDKSLFINKILGGHELTKEEIYDLIQKGKIGPFDDFKSRAGKNFSACIILENGRSKIEFNEDSKETQERIQNALNDLENCQVVCDCPLKCGGKVYLTEQGYLCEHLKDKKCHLRAGKRILSRDISIEEFQELAKNGRTSLLDGFISNRTGKAFSAFLVLDKEGKIKFEFAPRPPKTPTKTENTDTKE